jgi:glycosyltransferase involved in cell wall biosynthesis
MMKTLIIVPAYNEEGSVTKVVESLSLVKDLADYVIVNDGSMDRTAEICLKNGYPLINLPVNTGLAGAFQAGIKYAIRNQYDRAIQFDGDGQHNACYIRQMIARMESTGCDVVIGSRFLSEKKPKSFRMFGNNIIQFAVRITTKKMITDPTSGMRLYNRRMLKILANSKDLGPEPDTLSYLARSGASIQEVQVTMNERTAGKSYLSFSRSMKYMLHMCLSIFFIQWFRNKLTIS